MIEFLIEFKTSNFKPGFTSSYIEMAETESQARQQAIVKFEKFVERGTSDSYEILKIVSLPPLKGQSNANG